jgi:phosphatidylcholine synthase
MRLESRWPQKVAAYLVHFYTAAGIAFAFLAVAEICKRAPDPRWVFLWLMIAAALDATDGPLARYFRVAAHVPHVMGRTIDDIVDYLTYTFVPLLLVWRMEWLAEPQELWVAVAMIASLFGFSNVSAKGKDFFLGFPSYWNVFAFYTGLWVARDGRVFPTCVLALLTLMTFVPMRFVYPNLAPSPWRSPLIIGGILWLCVVLAVLPSYPNSPQWLVWISAAYPIGYVALSIGLMRKRT